MSDFINLYDLFIQKGFLPNNHDDNGSLKIFFNDQSYKQIILNYAETLIKFIKLNHNKLNIASKLSSLDNGNECFFKNEFSISNYIMKNNLNNYGEIFDLLNNTTYIIKNILSVIFPKKVVLMHNRYVVITTGLDVNMRSCDNFNVVFSVVKEN
jgi:hypothetical protein